MKKCVFILLSFILLGCKKKDSISQDVQIFRYNEHANITSLDPAFAKDQRNIWVCNLLYNSLVKLDSNLEIVPDLASSWEVSDDAITYTFILKNNVRFHGGYAFAKARFIKASDVVYSLNRLTDPKIASSGAWIMKPVDKMTVLNDSTIQFKLKEAYPAFLGLLSMKYASVVQPEVVNHFGNLFRDHPSGTGPFKLKAWEENVKMVLRKNDWYFEKDENGKSLPYLDAVAITFKSDKQSEFLEYAQGNIDFINAIDPSYKDELLTTQGVLKPKYTAYTNYLKSPFLNTEYLAINLKNGVQENESLILRQAVNMGFDRFKMIQYLRNNIGKPAVNGFLPAGLPGGGNVQGYTYNPVKARNLIKQYSKKTGDKNPEISVVTTSNYLDLCEFFQKEMQKIGVRVDVEVMPPSSLKDARLKGNLSFFRSSWIADYPDAENYLSLFYSKNVPPVGSNYTGFANANFDSLYEQSLKEANSASRIQLYTEMDSIIIANAPVVPLYYDESVRFINKSVKGMVVNGVNMLDLTRVYKQPQ